VAATQKDLTQALRALQQEASEREETFRSSIEELQVALSAALRAGGQKGQPGGPDPWTAYIRRWQLLRRIRETVRAATPSDATVLVASRGDEQFLLLDGHRAWHFPQLPNREYAGSAPPNSTAAIAHLEYLRSQGADVFVLPQPTVWWLDRYPEFARHLEGRYRLIAREGGVCMVFSLRDPPLDSTSWSTTLGAVLQECRIRLHREPAVLDWSSGLEPQQRFQEFSIFSPPAETSRLPYLDESIDVVLVREGDTEREEEARRVACGAVVVASLDGETAEDGASCTVHWKLDRASPLLPSASVVIPSYNGAHYTDACLAALWETLPPGCDAEVIVVDDASTDDTPMMLARWAEREPRLRTLRNRVNAGFLETCNRGARAASKDVVIFLNNDTVPLPGWLEPLLTTLVEHPDAGAVGGKLVYPDGVLQEAGGTIFKDGQAANFGKGDDPEAPLYNFVRQVDYVSGALLATPRTLFLERGGFDSRYRPIYYEDADYCLTVRDAGRAVYYQPESVIVHVEGGTNGTDISVGAKRFQEVNRAKFADKWSKVLADRGEAPSRYDRSTWHALSVRDPASGWGSDTANKRVLVCAPVLPEFDRESGSRRIFHHIQALREAGWTVAFVAKNQAGDRKYVRILQQAGVQTHLGFDAGTDQMIAAGRFDVAILAFWYFAENAAQRIRRLSPLTRIAVDSIDLHFLRSARRVFGANGSKEARAALGSEYAAEMIREVNVYASSDVVLAVSRKEADLIDDLTADPHLANVVPDREHLSPSTIPFSRRRGILFLGNFRHPPNVDAVEYLCGEIVPRLDRRLLERHPVYVVGNGLSGRVQALCEHAGVHVVGWVPSVVPYLHQARISVIPLRYGAGTKRKLIQALMAGTPTVTSSPGMEGLDVEPDRHVLLADDADTFAQAIARLMKDSQLWRGMSKEGRKRVEMAHGSASTSARLVETADASLARAPKAHQHDSQGAGQPYQVLIRRIRDVVRDELPPDARMLVVSKGDDQLLNLFGRQAWHFPRGEHGEYAGYYPADSDQAIAHLEELRQRGAQFLLIPRTSLWWLDHYHGFADYLQNSCSTVVNEAACAIYALDGGSK
jgi:GT2 family glycosyltransferase